MTKIKFQMKISKWGDINVIRIPIDIMRYNPDLEVGSIINVEIEPLFKLPKKDN